jgi:folate-dependent tRNA-U54 methylase TrmFO/GidA
MNNSDETLKKTPENETVLQAIADLARTVAELSNTVNNLSGKFDNLEKFAIVQFEAVREGIEYNSSRYDRLEAKFFDVRSDVSNMRSDIRELNQAVRKKELV